MVSFFDIINPSFILFPAMMGSAILALVCPLVGAHLILRRRVFLGLTLPQVAACGVAFTFWIYHEAGATSSGNETTFELLIDRALLSLYNPRESGLPLWPPQYLKWRPS